MQYKKVTLQITEASNNRSTSKIHSCNLHCKIILIALCQLPMHESEVPYNYTFLSHVRRQYIFPCTNFKLYENHQIKYLSSFVAFKCFGFSVFTLAASHAVCCTSACMGPWLSLVCDLKWVVVLIAFLSLQWSVLKCVCLSEMSWVILNIITNCI